MTNAGMMIIRTMAISVRAALRLGRFSFPSIRRYRGRKMLAKTAAQKSGVKNGFSR